MKLLIATRNNHKLKEFKSLLKNLNVTIISPNEVKSIPSTFDVKEAGTTFKQNAILKAKGYGKLTNLLTLADDSGFTIDYLDGQPGIHSGRFAKGDFPSARKRLLQLLKVAKKSNRTAQFRCVLALYNPQTQKIKTFSGITHGWISKTEQGNSGFGYDSIFIAKKINKTYAQATPVEKNKYSHRALAFKKLINYLTIHQS